MFPLYSRIFILKALGIIAISSKCAVVRAVDAIDVGNDASMMTPCSLCFSQDDTPQDPTAQFSSGNMESMTCQEAFDLGELELPIKNCTAFRNVGASICQCGPALPPSAVPNDCTLCTDKGPLPEPRKEVRPQRICSLLQIDAKRDDPSTCEVWQSTYGKYCGCDNEFTLTPICRICDESTTIFDPLAIADGESGATCGDVEFQANAKEITAGLSCSAYSETYGGKCCKAIPPPTTAPVIDDTKKDRTSNGLSSFPISTMVVVTMLSKAVLDAFD